MDVVMVLSSVILFFCLCKVSVICEATFTIRVSKNGKDISECRNVYNDSKLPCLTLDYALQGGKGLLSNTKLLLDPGNFLLQNDTEFQSKENISFFGGSSYEKNTITCSSENVGLSFLRCRGVTIRGLTFKNCGRKRQDTSHNKMIYSGIHFVFSKDINISSSLITESRGTGITMLDVGGFVFVENVDILRNTFNDNGGGAFIAMTTCGALDLVNCTFHKEQQKYIHNAKFTFRSVKFSGNIDKTNISNLFEETQLPQSFLGKGGGLTIHLNGNASQNQFSFALCSFYGNEANWGGGLYIGVSDEAQNNNVTMLPGLTFWKNKATYGGGAVQITLLHAKVLAAWKENFVLFTSSYFGLNNAVWGGAVSIKANTRMMGNIEKEVSKSIIFQSCSFYFNKATVGSAIAMATKNLNVYTVGPGVPYALSLNNSFITLNEIITTEDKKVIGQGAIYAEQFTVHVESTPFRNNTGTALVLDSSSLMVHGQVNFLFNQGIKGGAVALYGNSWIQLTSNSELIFQENRAYIKGGAIYFKSSGPSRLGFTSTKLATSRCFFRYEKQVELDPSAWNCKVRFINNTAPDATGSSIFASTLEMCRQAGEPRMNNTAFEWPNVFEYSNKPDVNSPEIVTEAIQLFNNRAEWNAQPSIPFTASVTLLDEKGNSVYGTVKVNITSDEDPKIHLDPPNNVFLIKDAMHDIRLVGSVGKPFNMSFITTDGQLIETNVVRQSLNYCPPGYKQDDKSTVCTCMEAEKAITRCENYTAYLLRGYWGHIGNNHVFEAFKCPKHYCTCDISTPSIPYECPYPMIKCAKNREGVLCGKCKAGMSVKLGDEICDYCSNLYLLLLIPIVLIASLFVLFVFYFNIDAFSGYLNAFLYSYQSIDTVIPETVTLDPFISCVIGLMCLSGTGNSFGLCLWDGFNDLHKLGFNLAVPLFILLFTILVGTCLSGELFRKIFGNSLRSKSFGRALSFVYTYCYTALTSKALLLLNPVTIENQTVVFAAPEFKYFGKEHTAYAVAAIIVLLVFTVGFPVILLFTPFFTKKFQWLLRMEPAFDVLKLCFKNPLNSRNKSDCRSFAAFYFICRLVVLLFDIFVKDETPRLVLIALSSVCFQVIFTWFQPYVVWTLNFWDVILLTNMCFVSLVSIILSVPYILYDVYRQILVYVLKILVYIPLLIIIARLFVYSRSKINRCKRRSSTILEDIPRRLHEDEPSELSEVGAYFQRDNAVDVDI
eukprot:gene238-9878_t